MIIRILLWWFGASAVFLLGWFACARLHLAKCEEEKVFLLEALITAQTKLARLERERERGWS